MHIVHPLGRVANSYTSPTTFDVLSLEHLHNIRYF